MERLFKLYHVHYLVAAVQALLFQRFLSTARERIRDAATSIHLFSYSAKLDCLPFIVSGSLSGHVAIVSLLIQNKRWKLLATLLDEELYARTNNYAQPAFVPFTALCRPATLLYQRNERLELHKLSLQGNLLYERHAEGDLATIVPIEQFMEADYFLFLRDLLQLATKPKQIKWRAWSTILMTKPARFLHKAIRGDFAE